MDEVQQMPDEMLEDLFLTPGLVTFFRLFITFINNLFVSFTFLHFDLYYTTHWSRENYRECTTALYLAILIWTHFHLLAQEMVEKYLPTQSDNSNLIRFFKIILGLKNIYIFN